MSNQNPLIARGTWDTLHRSNGTLPRNRGAAVGILSQSTTQGGDLYRAHYFDMLRKAHPAIVTYLTVALCDPTNTREVRRAQRALTSEERRVAGHIIAAIESKTKRPSSEVFASTSAAKKAVEESNPADPSRAKKLRAYGDFAVGAGMLVGVPLLVPAVTAAIALSIGWGWQIAVGAACVAQASTYLAVKAWSTQHSGKRQGAPWGARQIELAAPTASQMPDVAYPNAPGSPSDGKLRILDAKLLGPGC